MSTTFDRIITGDSLTELKKLPDQCVHCVVTSPPYWGLRDYKTAGQIGLEKSPEEFIQNLVIVFREVHRVLKNNGTLWIIIGDSYCHSGGQYSTVKSTLQGSQPGPDEYGMAKRFKKHSAGLKTKDLVGVPWMLAFALRADGWYLRQDIIWHKPNPMPESVQDRCTRAHEYIFMLTKSAKYFYDHSAIKTVAINPSDDARRIAMATINGKSAPAAERNGIRKTDKQRGHSRRHNGFNDRWDNLTVNQQISLGANKRSVWTVATEGFKGAHFATFPAELIMDCIKAGCAAGGIILDPFMGSGTTALVAKKLGRHYLGIELNQDYVKMANERLQKELGLFI